MCLYRILLRSSPFFALNTRACERRVTKSRIFNCDRLLNNRSNKIVFNHKLIASVMTNLNQILRLYLLAKIHPQLWEIIGGGISTSRGTINVIAGMYIKGIAAGIEDKELSATINAIGRTVFADGAKNMDYDEEKWSFTNSIWFHGPHSDWIKNVAFFDFGL